jgi:hypothetical protein
MATFVHGLIFFLGVHHLALKFMWGQSFTVLGIRIRWIRTFLGLLGPDPLVGGPDPDPSVIFQAKIVRKTLIPTFL